MSAVQAGSTVQGREPAQAEGDRAWQDAGRDTLSGLAKLVRKRAKAIDRTVGVDEVHDMRTATRRLRTAITIYGELAPKKRRAMIEDELECVADRLGAVRDLDVLLATLDDAMRDAGAPDDLRRLRDAWRSDRNTGARRLKTEIGRPRFRRALRAASRLFRGRDEASNDRGPVAHRVATQAPVLIWAAFGTLLGYEVEPMNADPAMIHELRIAAKKLRYTLESFEGALEPGTSLIDDVTALQDEAGSMHDAIVARDRARSTIRPRELTRRRQRAIDGFADSQAKKAEDLRPAIVRRLRRVRSRAFRESLGRAVAGMGHVRV